jgi:hypothetical protein
MVAYGDTDTVAQLLEPDQPSGFSDALTTRIDSMREVVSRLIDEKIGRSFGTAGVSETRTIRSYMDSGGMLLLDTPVRSISAITTNVDDEAGVISGGSVLADSQWTVGLEDGNGDIIGLRGISNYWYGNWYAPYGVMTITGIWADTGTDTTIPAEIDWACNYVSAKTIAEENTSPSGFVGDDGQVSYPRNPWNHPQVKDILRKYRIPQQVLVL